MKNADRVFYFEEGPRAAPGMVAKALPRRKETRSRWRRLHEMVVSSMAAKSQSQDYFG